MFRSAVQRNRDRFLAILGVAIGLLCALTANAQSQTHAADSWSFTATPYFWATGVEGDIGVRDLPDVRVDADFSDVWDVLDFSLMGMFEARKDRFGLLFDSVYAKLSDDADTPGPVFGDAEVEFTHQTYSLAAAYRVSNRPTPLDLLAGVRYVHVKADVDLGAGLLPARSASRSEDWWDGFVGVRARVPVNDRWWLLFYGDAGAGGSDFTWQAIGGVGYRASDRFDLQFGYRHFDFDYDDGSGPDRFVYEVEFSGPYVGLGIKF